MTLLVGFSVLTTAWAVYRWPIESAIRSYEPQEGDIVFQSLPHAPLVNTIEGVTQSRFSHCGLVVAQDGRWFVLEAFDGVEETPLREFLLRGRQSAFAAYRLKEKRRDVVSNMVATARSFLGRPYDARYRMDDEAIYCSELIYKAYSAATDGESLGSLEALGDLNWRPYVDAIEYFEQGPVPLERKMITPVNLARASQLELVQSFRLAVTNDR